MIKTNTQITLQKRTLISFDWAMKRLLRNKANFGILNDFISELLSEDIQIEVIVESESNSTSEDDKYNKLDLMCRIRHGELIAIEVQYFGELDYFHRCLFGTSKLITEYLYKGEPYALIRKVYSINILYFDLGSGEDYIYIGRTEFTGMHTSQKLELSEKQKLKFMKSQPHEIFPEYYLLKVNNFDNVAKNTLDEWIYFLKNTSLPEHYTALGLQLVEDQLNYDNMDTTAKFEYDQYLKHLRISEDALETAMEKGDRQRRISIILKCKQEGWDIQTIARIVELSENEVGEIIEEHGTK